MEHPFAVTLDPGTSLKNRTGSWRTSRPVYVHRLSPCSHACPAGEDVQGWLAYAEGGDYEAAWRKLTENNPFPAVMGRVCYYPCENVCNRAVLDSSGAFGQEGADQWRGAIGIIGGLSSRAARPRRDDQGSRAFTGRHDAVRHPEIPAAA